MSLSFADFWKLAIASRVVTLDEAKQLHAAFARVKGANKGNGGTLAEWLISQAVLTRYQADFLLSGQPGPFVFGDYRVYDRIASGRLTDLYKAMHTASGHPVLLAFLSGEGTQNPNQWRAVSRQAQTTIAAACPQLAKVFELVDAEGYKFVVLEDLTGESIEQRYAGQRAVAAEAAKIAQQAAVALTRLHAQGGVHGDVRPANLWLEPSGASKLLGFPLQRDALLPDAIHLGDTNPQGRTLAAIDYLAPELGQPGRPPDALSDIYALGCTLFRLLSGNVPFAAGDVRTKLHRHATEPIAPLDRVAAVPPQLVQVLAYMMAKNPQVRYQQAAQVAEALAPFAASAATVVPNPNARSLQSFEQTLTLKRARQSSSAPQDGPATKRGGANGSTTPPGQSKVGDARAKTTAGQQKAAAGGASSGNGANAAPTPRPAPAGVAVAPQAASLGTLTPEFHDDGIPEFGELQMRPSASATQTGGAPAMLPLTRPAKKKSNSNLIVLGTVAALVLVVGVVLVVANAGKQPVEQASGDQSNVQVPAAQPVDEPANNQVAATNVTPNDAEAIDEPQTPAETKTKQGRKKKPQPDDGTAPGDADTRRPKKPAISEIADDGQTMWTSPTRGEPISVQFVPSGAQVFFTVRPAELLASVEGQKLPVALGPAYDWLVAQAKVITGLNPEQIDYLLAAFSPVDASEMPQAAIVVHTKEDMSSEALLELWKKPAASGEGEKKYYTSGPWAYYIPSNGKQRIFVVAPASAMAEIVSMDGPPALSRALEKMLRDSDASRHVNMLFSQDLFTDLRLLFAGNLERLREPLRGFLGDDSKAALLSLQFGDDFFAELRVLGALDKPPVQLAMTYKDQVGDLQKQIRNFMAQITPQPYGKAVLIGFEGMIRQMTDMIRVGEENGNSLVRCYLPGPAGHNLVMATELALNERPGTVAAVAVKTDKPKAALTAAEAMKQKITLSFPRDTLEKCMEYFGKEIGVEVVILGADLQLDGITKNQSFGLEERDQPADEILRKVMKLANPDGKLIYVIKPKKEGEKDIVFITTRAAAEKRGDKLPPELVVDDPKKKK